MKKNILILFMLIGYSAFSTTWTVDNNTGAGAQFTSLQAAHDAASAGDTLLVKGSSQTYGSLNVTKEIHVIGEGFKPNKNQFEERTTLARITISIANSSADNPSNTTVSGIYFLAPSSTFRVLINGFNSSTTLSGVRFDRCYFNLDVRIAAFTPGLIFNQCIFDNGLSFSETTNGSSWTVQNSILSGLGPYQFGGNGGNRIVRNCVFYGTGVFAPTGLSITFENNIFYGYLANNPNGTLANSTFRNNLCFGNSDNSFKTTDGCVSINNISSQDPQFVTASLPATSFDFNNDWNLQGTSPGKNYGTDGTDIGIYGGSGFVEGGVSGSGFQTAPMPAIPQMLELNIQNPVVPENGNLNVKIIGRKQQ